MSTPFPVLINTDLFPLHSSEKWMASPAMLRLNPTGGFSLLKYHMHVAHNIDIAKMSVFTALIRSISERIIYDHLQDEIRCLFHLFVKTLFLVTGKQSLINVYFCSHLGSSKQTTMLSRLPSKLYSPLSTSRNTLLNKRNSQIYCQYIWRERLNTRSGIVHRHQEGFW